MPGDVPGKIYARSRWLTPSLGWGLVAIVGMSLSLWQAGLFQRELLNLDGWEQLGRFVLASVQPDLSEPLLRLTLDATLTTFAFAVCGTVLSLVLGLLGGLLASEVWWAAVMPRRSFLMPGFLVPWLLVRAGLAVPRAIHELIWGLFFVNLWGLDPLTAVLAIALPFGAITAKVFAEILDETPRQPLQALLSSGSPPLAAFLYSLLPQAFLNLLSYSFYRFECSLRSAAVLGIVGAGGLGYQILLSLQSLRYEQLWTFFYALVLLNGAVDFGSAWLRNRLGCASRLDLNLSKGAPSRFIRSPLLLKLVGLGGLLLVPVCFWYVQADFSKLWNPRTQRLLGQIAKDSLPPDWSGLGQLGDLAGQTIAMSVLAIGLAAIGGVVLSFPAAANFLRPGGLLISRASHPQWHLLGWLTLIMARFVLLVCRAIPAPIWALVVLFVLFPGVLPGAIALGLHNLGILGRLMAEVVENLDNRPLEALKAQGGSGPLVFLYGVLPLSLPRFLAYALYRWEVCMRETVIVGLVGAGGLGRVLTEQLSSFDYRAIVVTLAGFVVLTFLVDGLSATVRRSLR